MRKLQLKTASILKKKTGENLTGVGVRDAIHPLVPLTANRHQVIG